MKQISDVQLGVALKVAVEQFLEEEARQAKGEVLPVPAAVRARNLRMIRRWRNRHIMEAARRWMSRAAVVVLAVGTMMFTAAMCIEPVRATFWEAVVTWYEEYIGVWFDRDDTPGTIMEKCIPSYLPDGWTIEIVEETKDHVYYLIKGEAGEEILYAQYTDGSNDMWSDNTYDTFEIRQLKEETTCMVIVNEKGTIICWQDQYRFMASILNCPIDIALNIFASING